MAKKEAIEPEECYAVFVTGIVTKKGEDPEDTWVFYADSTGGPGFFPSKMAQIMTTGDAERVLRKFVERATLFNLTPVKT